MGVLCTYQHVVHKRIGCRRLLQQNAVLRVGGQLLGVGGVGGRSLDFGDEALVEEGLASVRGRRGNQGAVGGGGGVEVDQEVDV